MSPQFEEPEIADGGAGRISRIAGYFFPAGTHIIGELDIIKEDERAGSASLCHKRKLREDKGGGVDGIDEAEVDFLRSLINYGQIFLERSNG